MFDITLFQPNTDEEVLIHYYGWKIVKYRYSDLFTYVEDDKTLWVNAELWMRLPPVPRRLYV